LLAALVFLCRDILGSGLRVFLAGLRFGLRLSSLA
jgi:hypothetical protein